MPRSSADIGTTPVTSFVEVLWRKNNGELFYVLINKAHIRAVIQAPPNLRQKTEEWLSEIQFTNGDRFRVLEPYPELQKILLGEE